MEAGKALLIIGIAWGAVLVLKWYAVAAWHVPVWAVWLL